MSYFLVSGSGLLLKSYLNVDPNLNCVPWEENIFEQKKLVFWIEKMLLSAEVKEIGPVFSKTTYKSLLSCQILISEFIQTVPSSSKVFLGLYETA